MDERQMSEAERLWRLVTLTDDFMFKRVMGDMDFCAAMIEVLLGIKVDKIERLDEEKSVKTDMDARGVRFDIYVMSGGKRFDIEIQKGHFADLPLRSRYYQAMMDCDALKNGESFHRLCKNYVVFLCADDPFGKGLPVYTVEARMKETNGLFDDGTRRVFFNASAFAKASDVRLSAFLRYLAENEATDDFTRRLDSAVRKAKRSRSERRAFMTLQEKIDERFEFGVSQGISQTARNMAAGGLSVTQIAKFTGLSREEIERL